MTVQSDILTQKHSGWLTDRKPVIKASQKDRTTGQTGQNSRQVGQTDKLTDLMGGPPGKWTAVPTENRP